MKNDPQSVFLRLLSYCQSNDWAGYDPYDALNSKLFAKSPFANSRVARLVLTQALKRSPVNFRSLLLIPKTQNPKGLALFLSALLKTSWLSPATSDVMIDALIEKLLTLRSPGEPYWCWGYSFPWQTRSTLIPRNVANLVCTVFVTDAILDLYEQRPEAKYLAITQSAAAYITEKLYWTNGSDAGFSYPHPSARNQVHNANLLAASLLCRVHKFAKDESMFALAMEVARCSVSKQNPDGSWPYGEGSSQQWIDNFHTGYNLCALMSIAHSSATSEFDTCLQRGYEFYAAHLFREDGAPKYYSDRTFPLDIHCVAQSIITLLAFKDKHLDNVERACSVFEWAMQHMWDKQGFFYYRILRAGKVRTSYMRWSQAWMLAALAQLVNATDSSNDNCNTLCLGAAVTSC